MPSELKRNKSKIQSEKFHLFSRKFVKFYLDQNQQKLYAKSPIVKQSGIELICVGRYTIDGLQYECKYEGW